MSDSGGEPQRPGWGLDFRVPGERREYSFSLEREEFPRLGEPEKPKPRPAGRISGAWGLVPLTTFVLLFVSFVLAPTTPEVEYEDDSSDVILGLILVGGLLAPYLAGSVAAFKGSRKGLLWTLPMTAVFLLLALVAAFDEEAVIGGSRIAAATVALGAAGLHVLAVVLTKPRASEPAHTPAF